MSYRPNAYLVHQHTISIRIQFPTMSHEQSRSTALPTTTSTTRLAEILGLREQIFGKIFYATTLGSITNTAPRL